METQLESATVQQAVAVGRIRFPSRRAILEKMRIKRKDYLVQKLSAEAARLSDQARFIMEKCNNTLVVENKKRKTMIDELIKRGYRADPVKEWEKKVAQGEKEEEKAGGGKENEEDANVSKYDYLLGMSMWMLTDERKEELLKQRDTKLFELAEVKGKTPEILWKSEFGALEKKLGEIYKATKATQTGKRKHDDDNDEIYPDTHGVKVECRVTEEKEEPEAPKNESQSPIEESIKIFAQEF